MADVTFSVDVVMNLIDKTVQSSLKSAESSVKGISDSAKNVPTGLIENLEAESKQLLTYGTNLNNIEKTMGSSAAKQYFNTIVEGGKASVAQLKRAQKATKQFNFGFLSLIFGGMALQRTFTNVYNTIIDGYKDFADQNDSFLTGLTELQGAFTFLKFIIGDAFANSPFVQSMIENITIAIQELAIFLDDHPRLAWSIVGIAIALAALGTVALIAGQMITIGMALDYFATAGLGSLMGIDVAALSTKIASIMSSLSAIGGAVVIGTSLVFAFNDLTDGSFDMPSNILTGLGLGIGALMMGVPPPAAILIGALAIAVTTAIEIAIDPEGFGAFTARLTNYLVELVESNVDLVTNALKAIFNPSYSLGDFMEDLDFSGFGESIRNGFRDEINRMGEEGELSRWLQNVYDSYGPAFSTSTTGNLGLIDTFSETFDEISASASEIDLSGVQAQISGLVEPTDALTVSTDSVTTSMTLADETSGFFADTLLSVLTPSTSTAREEISAMSDELERYIDLMERAEQTSGSTGFASRIGSLFTTLS